LKFDFIGFSIISPEAPTILFFGLAIKPQDWLRFLYERQLFKTFAVVTYRKTAVYNLVIERFFYKGDIFSFDSLLEAVNFIREQNALEPANDFDKLTQLYNDNSL
tara:strand:- start:1075 stop:1389 length:315 start_codon:yes stop_codon:yes gene_type:complete